MAVQELPNASMTVALGQMHVASDPDQNLATIRRLANRSNEHGVRLLVLPEGLIARDPDDPSFTNATAQPIDGPFVSQLRQIGQDTGIAIAGTVHVSSPGHPRARNTFLVIDEGEIIAAYEKLHLYDAFHSKESDNVVPGDKLPPLVELDGIRFGLMTCYDARFPELARALAVAGAHALLLPAAWVRGPDKRRHWEVVTAARALDNTVWVLATGEISTRNIGDTLVIDPLGKVVAQLDEEADELIVTTIDTATVDAARASLPVLANRRFADPTLKP